MKTNNKDRILYDNGIALSGGGARGFAHLGILKAFIENGLAPDIISGVSAGAIVGAFYANGYQPDEILEMFIEKRLFQLIHLTIPKEGLLKPAGFNELFNEYLKINDFSNLKIPLYVAATNINIGMIEYFSQGRLDEKIFALKDRLGNFNNIVRSSHGIIMKNRDSGIN